MHWIHNRLTSDVCIQCNIMDILLVSPYFQRISFLLKFFAIFPTRYYYYVVFQNSITSIFIVDNIDFEQIICTLTSFAVAKHIPMFCTIKMYL